MKYLLRIFVLALLPALLGPRPALAAGELWAGTAKVDITPEAGDALDILGRPLTMHDRSQARVLVLVDGSTSLAIVTIDMIVFASPKVVAEAKARFGLDHVILSSTHTHASMVPRGLVIKPPTSPDWTRSGRAPDETVDWPGLSSDPSYAQIESRVIEAIGQAKNNLFRARMSVGQGPFESAYMAHNRRLVKNGRATAMWDNPDRRPTQPIDPTVGVIRIEDLAGKPRALAVHYACHPVATMGAGVISRDFPGAMADHIEQELGEDCLAMFLQGAQGDLDPYDLGGLRGPNRFNISRQCGISLAKGALQLAKSLPAGKGDDQPAIQAKSSLLTIVNRSGGRSTEVGLLTIVIGGKLALVAIPGEPFIQHQLDLRAQSPLPNTWILGLAYHGVGTPFVVYIPTVQAVKEGGYGAAECSFLAADAGQAMIRVAVTQIRKLTEAR